MAPGEETAFPKTGAPNAIAGSATSSSYELTDPENEGANAHFFIFSDLSVRAEGVYRLQFSLYEVAG